MTTRWARVARGSVAALIATFVAAASHTAAGNAAPAPAAILLTLAFAVLTCVALTGASLSRLRLTVAVLVSQAFFHALFAGIGAGSGLRVSGGGQFVAPGTHHAAASAAWEVVSAVPAHPGGEHHLGMWIAHAVAAIVTVWALHSGESAFWALRDTARLALAALFTPSFSACAVVPSPPAPARPARVIRPRASLTLTFSMSRRGPPALI